MDETIKKVKKKKKLNAIRTGHGFVTIILSLKKKKKKKKKEGKYIHPFHRLVVIDGDLIHELKRWSTWYLPVFVEET